MSYYNFNDHFWPPQTVCSQSERPKSNKKSARRKTLTGILTLVCFAVWTPLLLELLVPSINKNQETTALGTSNFDGEHLVSKREHFLFYLSIQQR
ncbi:MAG: hypothetical protein HC862_01835 [Scytonema sp. RU_4_4]|nr:hypothetical protein [Scytonema sp. RU_4_4]NJR75544.1 hypothetical protein [Scytonema sp. CRU_2_7]